jgi:hypothetical protein
LISITSVPRVGSSVPNSTSRKTHPIHDPPVYSNKTGHIAPASIPHFLDTPVTLSHPLSDVNPWNHRTLAVGHVQNVRCGEGEQSDLELGDLLITDPAAIDAIRNGLRGVSVGYDAGDIELQRGAA